MGVLVLRDDRFLAHDAGAGHPERPARVEAIHHWLDETSPEGIQSESPPMADERAILAIHTTEHVERIAATADHPRVRLDPDTATSEDSYDAAVLAAGAVCRGVEACVGGEASGAFALVRPPGHHAEPGAAMGFCLFNNVAVAAADAIARLGCERVLILDPDVHHGNGTQAAFWKRRDVLFVSSHRYPFYPGSGWFDEVGEDEGLGYTLNLPMTGGMTDADCLHLYRTAVEPVVRAFAPDLILVSAGFDTWHRDPLGGMAMTEAGYLALFGLFHRWSQTYCPGRLVATLEGGYDLDGLVAGTRAALTAMRGGATQASVEGAPSEVAIATAARSREAMSRLWPNLAG